MTPSANKKSAFPLRMSAVFLPCKVFSQNDSQKSRKGPENQDFFSFRQKMILFFDQILYQILRAEIRIKTAAATQFFISRPKSRAENPAFPSALKKTAGLFTLPFLSFWCGREGLNLHALRHWILNPARLPVPPRPHELYCIIYIRGLSNRRGYFGVQSNGLILTRSLSASASTLSAPTCSAAASGIAAQARASSRAS